MDRTARISLAAVVLALGLAAACGDGQTGTHIGNPVASFALTVTDSDDNDPTSITFEDDSGLVYALSEASVYVRDIELDLPVGTTCDDVADELVAATCEADDSGGFKIVLPGPFAVDLIAETSTPSLASVRIPAIVYRRIDIRIDDGDPDDGVILPGDDLDDRSLVARAVFTYDGAAAELELLLRFNEVMRIESASGVTVPADGDLLAQLDVSEWLDGIGIGDCLDDGDLTLVGDRLVIDEDAGSGDCSDIENEVRDNIERSGEMAARSSGG